MVAEHVCFVVVVVLLLLFCCFGFDFDKEVV